MKNKITLSPDIEDALKERIEKIKKMAEKLNAEFEKGSTLYVAKFSRPVQNYPSVGGAIMLHDGTFSYPAHVTEASPLMRIKQEAEEKERLIERLPLFKQLLDIMDSQEIETDEIKELRTILTKARYERQCRSDDDY